MYEFYTLPFEPFPDDKEHKSDHEYGVELSMEEHIVREYKDKHNIDTSMKEFPPGSEQFHGKNIGSNE